MAGKTAYRNSAGRLLTLLSSFPNNQQIYEFLPGLITGNPGKSQWDKQQLSVIALMELDKLYREFLQDMADAQISDEQRNVLLSGLNHINQTVYPMALNGQMRLLTETEKSLLEVCATIIPQEDALEKEDIDKIRESVASLRSLVEEGEISLTLKKALLELIRLTEDAINRFSIHGAKGLKRAFKAMLGEAGDLYASERAKGKEDELKKSGVWSAISKHLRTVDSVVAKIQRYQPYLEKGLPILLGGP